MYLVASRWGGRAQLTNQIAVVRSSSTFSRRKKPGGQVGQVGVSKKSCETKKNWQKDSNKKRFLSSSSSAQSPFHSMHGTGFFPFCLVHIAHASIKQMGIHHIKLQATSHQPIIKQKKARQASKMGSPSIISNGPSSCRYKQAHCKQRDWSGYVMRSVQ